MRIDTPESPSSQLDEPAVKAPHPARWLVPFCGVLGLVCLLLSLYMQANARVPKVTTKPLSIAPPPAHGSDPEQPNSYERPGPSWQDKVDADLQRLRPLHSPMPSPQPGAWVLAHPEPGQSFSAYLDTQPHRPTAQRSILYVQPIGEFSAAQRRVVRLSAEYLSLYFRLPVKILPDLPTQVISVSAVRKHPRTHEFQLHTGTILSDVLAPRMPADAAAYLGLTAIDLFPHPRWNFVFGQAADSEPIGIWSLSRFGNPARSEESFQLTLLRTLKTATHETGHMFGMRHCKAHLCNMNGANSLEEADRWPLDPCPVCLAKLLWLTGTTPGEWLRSMLPFYEQHGLTDQAERTKLHLHALGS